MPKPEAITAQKVEFLAYLPPIQSAIMMSGDGDLLQVKMNVNLMNSPDAVRIIGMTGQKLKVTVEILTDLDDEAKKEAERNSSKVGSRRTTNRRDQRAGS